MTSVNTRGRAISWKGSLCLQGWDPLDVFVTLIKELRDEFTSSAVPWGNTHGWLYTMLHIQIKREKINQWSRCFWILHECSHSGDSVLDNNVIILAKTMEKHVFERKEGVCLVLFCIFFFFLTLTISNRTWRQRMDGREQPKTCPSLQTARRAPGWGRGALKWWVGVWINT